MRLSENQLCELLGLAPFKDCVQWSSTARCTGRTTRTILEALAYYLENPESVIYFVSSSHNHALEMKTQFYRYASWLRQDGPGPKANNLRAASCYNRSFLIGIHPSDCVFYDHTCSE
jgi:hypothetical protein